MPAFMRVPGLPECHLGGHVVFANGLTGWALRLEEHHVVVGLLDRGEPRGEVEPTGELLATPCGPALQGRVVDPLGRPLDGLGPVSGPRRLLESAPAAFADIGPLGRPLATGITYLDTLFPMSRGRSRAILGPRGSGKSTLGLDIVLYQPANEVVSIYALIGQPRRQLASLVATLREADALRNTIVVFTSPDDPPALRILTPLAACAQAEWFARETGRDTLCVFDSLDGVVGGWRESTGHLGWLPEAEGFLPRLLDRPCCLAAGGSVSALSLLETGPDLPVDLLPGPLGAYFSGVVVLDEERFRSGFRPAVDIWKSTGAGASPLPALTHLRKYLFMDLRMGLALQQSEWVGDRDESGMARERAYYARLVAVMCQPPARPIAPADQFLTLFAARYGILNAVPADRCAAFAHDLCKWLPQRYPTLAESIRGRFDLRGEEAEALRRAILAYLAEAE